MTDRPDSILLLGESGVGKTHYGAQLLNRLMNVEGVLRMEGQSTNLLPFQSAMSSLQEGRAADHTATSTYSESVWPIKDVQDAARISSGPIMAASRSSG